MSPITNIPYSDGDVLTYEPPDKAPEKPRLYFVNGILTTGNEHAQAATKLAELLEHPVTGVYNKSSKFFGVFIDGPQCLLDWFDIVGNKAEEKLGAAIKNAINSLMPKSASQIFGAADAIRQLIPESMLIGFIEAELAIRNRATLSLFRELRKNKEEPVLIIAHSQGNLITCDALWAMVNCYGQGSLSTIQVYSLASPTPFWPVGLRYQRKDYAHLNDPVPYIGDVHTWSIVKRIGGSKYGRAAGDNKTKYRAINNKSFLKRLIEPHDLIEHLKLRNIINRVRDDLGLELRGDYPVPPDLLHKLRKRY